MAYLAVLIWNLAVLAGTGYVVFALDRSGAWFLLALLLMGSVSVKTERRCKCAKKESPQ